MKGHIFLSQWPLWDSVFLPESLEEAMCSTPVSGEPQVCRMATAARAWEPFHTGTSHWGTGTQSRSRAHVQKNIAGPGRRCPGRAVGGGPGCRASPSILLFLCFRWKVLSFNIGIRRSVVSRPLGESLNKISTIPQSNSSPLC